MPIYHRKLSNTQTLDTAVLQVHAGEIWGKAAFGGVAPKVKAYVGALQAGDIGIEFETAISPTAGGAPPDKAYWTLGIPGVVPVPGAPGFVKMPVVLRKVIYPSTNPLFTVACVF